MEQTMMKAVCFTSRGNFKVKEIPLPQLKSAEDVKVKVIYAGLCGDDVHVLRGDLGGFQEDHIMGDEMSGIVVEVGDWAYEAGFRVGDRVSGISRSTCGKCRYCLSGHPEACKTSEPQGVMCEYIVLKYRQLCRLTDDIDLKTGALLPLVAVCAQCVQQANISFGSSVAIFGAGGVGLISLQLLSHIGAGEITVIEPVGSKRLYASEWGATHTINPLEENVFAEAYRITDNIGFNSVIETSGSTISFQTAMSVVSNLGTLVTPCIYHSDFKYALDMLDFLWRQITIRAVRSPSILRQHQIVQLMRTMDLSILTNNVFSINTMAKAYESFTSGKYPKILIEITPE